MRKERMEATLSVGRQLAISEIALDDGVAELAMLAAAMTQARRSAGLSAVVGQEALDKVAEAIGLASSARRATVEAHKLLDETKTSLGLREFAIGDWGKKPPITQPSGVEAAPLRVVG